jgi:hypothetical protein
LKGRKIMVFKKLTGRIKAIVVTAAMLATTLVTPAVSQLSLVTAASTTIDVNHTFVADGVEDGQRQATIKLSGLGNATKLTLNFTTDYSSDATVAVYGLGTTVSPYWVDITDSSCTVKTGGKTSFSINVDVPSDAVGKVNSVGVGVWYPKTNEEFTLTTIEVNGTGTTTTESKDPEVYTSQNEKSGTYTFTDNKDGTATITSTLSAQVEGDFDYLLTRGYDEESYIVDGVNTYEDGDPINSHKFTFGEFGIGDLNGVQFQSFEYTIESDKAIDTFMYGGGINVQMGSIADTEYAKGKDGYWYNDQGTEDIENYGDAFQIDDYNTGYEVSNLGTYSKIVWDVPKSVQPYVTLSDTDSVGIQFWYGTTSEVDETATASESDDPENALDEVHITSAECTYTRTATVPYNKTISKSVNKILTAGSDESTNQVKLSLGDLKLGERDVLSAVKFTLSSASDIGKFVGGLGISVDLTNAVATEGWYQTGNVVVLNAGDSIDVMWIIPTSIRSDLTLTDDGNIMFGTWYGENSDSFTVKTAEFYVYESTEPELEVSPTKLNVAVGETVSPTVNVSGCTLVPSTGGYIQVNTDGSVTGLKEGACKLTITTPEGQSQTIDVIVDAAVTTTAVTTTAVTTQTTVATTTTATTTEDPDNVIDWTKVLYGDVDLNGKIQVADVVTLNLYLLDTESNKLNATAKENADCEYDHNVDMADASKLINYLAELIPQTELGDPDFY